MRCSARERRAMASASAEGRCGHHARLEVFARGRLVEVGKGNLPECSIITAPPDGEEAKAFSKLVSREPAVTRGPVSRRDATAPDVRMRLSTGGKKLSTERVRQNSRLNRRSAGRPSHNDRYFGGKRAARGDLEIGVSR